MKLIAGLGNPGKKYAKNRHNVGFMVVDSFATDEGLSWRINSDWMCNFAKAADYLIIKPKTYVNKSGEAVITVSNFYNINPDDILVVHDDLDIKFGQIRLSFGGRSAGHHGVESIIKSLSTPDFARLRIGIDHPKQEAGEKSKTDEDYVLSEFENNKMQELARVIKRSTEAVRSYLGLGIHATMNEFN